MRAKIHVALFFSMFMLWSIQDRDPGARRSLAEIYKQRDAWVIPNV